MKIPQPGFVVAYSQKTQAGVVRLDDGTEVQLNVASTDRSEWPLMLELGQRVRVAAIATTPSGEIEATALESWMDEHSPPPRSPRPSPAFVARASEAFDLARAFAEENVPKHFAAAFDGRAAIDGWAALLTAMGTPEPMRTELLEAAQPTARLIATGSTPALGQSKLGGRPDLAAGFRWPQYEGTPHTFLGQIRTAELPVAVREHLQLELGQLSFFYEVESATWGLEEADLGAIHVAWSPEGTTLVPRDPPDGAALLEEVAVALVDDVTIPSSAEMYFDIPEAELAAWAMARIPISAAVQLHAERHGTPHGQVGGCARRRQPDPGLPPSLVLLFQREQGAELQFTDLGQLMIWMDRADVATKHFHRAVHEVESG